MPVQSSNDVITAAASIIRQVSSFWHLIDKTTKNVFLQQALLPLRTKNTKKNITKQNKKDRKNLFHYCTRPAILSSINTSILPITYKAGIYTVSLYFVNDPNGVSDTFYTFVSCAVAIQIARDDKKRQLKNKKFTCTSQHTVNELYVIMYVIIQVFFCCMYVYQLKFLLIQL